MEKNQVFPTSSLFLYFADEETGMYRGVFMRFLCQLAEF